MQPSIRMQKRFTLGKRLRKYWQIWLLIIPSILVLFYFKYYPMYGAQIAFRNYNLSKGITGSDWVGLDNFQKLLKNKMFVQSFWNTLIINSMSLVFAFSASVFLALMINEIKNTFYKRFVQTVTYLPYFLSWVIVYAMFNSMLSLNTGIVNKIISFFGGQQIIFLSSTKWFRSILVASEIWKNSGWNTIVILAGITAIDPSLYEAAVIDGASRFKSLLHVTLPGIRSTILVLFIIRLGQILNNDVSQVLLFYSPGVYEVGDVVGTFVYRMGIDKMKFSLTSAAGLIQSVIGMGLMIITNSIAHKFGERGLW